MLRSGIDLARKRLFGMTGREQKIYFFDVQGTPERYTSDC